MTKTQKIAAAVAVTGIVGYIAWYYLAAPLFKVLEWDVENDKGVILWGGKRYYLDTISNDTDGQRFAARNGFVLERHYEGGQSTFKILKDNDLIKALDSRGTEIIPG